MKGYVESRQWGDFEILDEGKNYKVKRLAVKPGKSTSLQYHLHRDEWWRVVQGSATITYEGRKLELHENQGFYVRKLKRHRIENAASDNLVIIEVQYGTYLGEDDIVRLEQ